MLKIFDYIYYRLTKAPGVIDREGDSAGFLSAFQSLNILTLLLFLFPVLFIKFSGIVFGILWGSLWIILFALNGGFIPISNTEKYFKRTKKCEEKWDNEPKKTKRLKGILIVVYFLVSFLAFMLVLVRGGR